MVIKTRTQNRIVTFKAWRQGRKAKLARVGLLDGLTSLKNKTFRSSVRGRVLHLLVRTFFKKIPLLDRSAAGAELVEHYRFVKWLLSRTYFLGESQTLTAVSCRAPIKLFSHYAQSASGYFPGVTMFNNKKALSRAFSKANSFPNLAIQMLDRPVSPPGAFFAANTTLRTKSLYCFYRYVKNMHPFQFLTDSTDLLQARWRQHFWRKRLRTRRSADHIRYIRHRWRIIDFKRFLQVAAVRRWVSGASFGFTAKSGNQPLKSFGWYPKKAATSTSQNYIRKLWRICFRLKFERFIFNRIGRRVYSWFHSLWAVYFKKQQKWRSLEKRIIASLFNRRRRKKMRIKIRINILVLFVRAVGFLGLVSGSLHCFMHIVSLLFKRVRKHWILLRFIKSAIRRCRRRLGTITSFCMSIAGKFTGKMRKKKHIFCIGNVLKLFLYDRRVSYITTCAHTKWGVFGFQVWVHYSNTLRRAKHKTRLHRNEKSLLYYQRTSALLDVRTREQWYDSLSQEVPPREVLHRLTEEENKIDTSKFFKEIVCT